MSKTISQKNWKKGLVANTPDQAQPPGSLSRISNLLYTRRGGLRACDGSQIISLKDGALQTSTGPWTELYLFKPVNVNAYYIGIKKDFTVHLAAPAGLAVVDGGAGGTLGAATYFYVVTALDGAGGETVVSNEVSIVNPGGRKNNLSWGAVSNSVGYRVYQGTAGAGSELQLNTTAATNSFVDDGSVALTHSPSFPLPPLFVAPPAVNTTQAVLFYKIPASSYGAGTLLATFPADPFVPNDGTPGGTGGSPSTAPPGASGGPSGGAPPTPQGGNTGNTSPTPMIAQFANTAFLALGNGFAPRLFTDPSTVAAITNTFTSIYPDWNANIVVAVGDLIRPTVNNAGGFVFKCTQGGTTSNVNPVFPQTLNQVVAESGHNVLWQNIGIGSSTPAPRGAAHAEVYAGALWVANTSPTTTSDFLDGPSALRMSDINNPSSWNPLNTAFLDRDDGDQVTGLKAMTIAESGIPPTGSLVAFKNFKTFQINGVFGSSNFSIQRAQTDLGCIASRTIEFCPGFGLIRLTHLGFALFDTTRDHVISEDIRPFLFPDTNIPDIQSIDWNYAYLSKAAQTANPPMYCCAVPVVPFSAAEAVIFSAVDAASTWPGAGTKTFFKASSFTLVNGVVTETGVGVEFSPLQPFTTGLSSPEVQGTPATGVVKYRIYYGNQSLTYTNYVEITPAQLLAGVVFHSAAAFTQSGALTIGIGGLTRLMCYDLVQKCWAIIDLPWAIEELAQVRPLGSIPITVTGGFLDGSVRRIQSGDLTWDGTPVAWSVRPAELLAGGGTSRVFYQRVTVKGIGPAASVNSITVTPSYDYADDIPAAPVIFSLGQQRFLAWVDLLITSLTAHATVQGSGPVEIDALDWEVDPLPENVPPQFA